MVVKCEIDGNTVTATRCTESLTDTPMSMTGTWDANVKAYVIPPNDRWSTATTCLRQVTFGAPPNQCIAKEACKVVVVNSNSQRFHCSRACFTTPNPCTFADAVEADCY